MAPDVDMLQKDPDGTKYIFQPDPLGIHPSPLYTAEAQKSSTERIRTLGAMDFRYTPLSWLSADANASYDRADANGSTWLDRGLKSEAQATGGPGSLTLTDAYTSASTLGQRKPAQGFQELDGSHDGPRRHRTPEQRESGGRRNQLRRERCSANRCRALSEQLLVANGHSAEGYFLTAGLDYNGKLIGDALVRRDASSLFGPGEQWHTYYRASGAYRMAQEEWWPFKRVNEFKLRLSQGTAGTRPSFADQFETYTVSSNGTLAKSTLGNRFLKPETAHEREYGLDMVFDNRFSLQLTRADNRTTDELVAVPLPGAIGFTTQWQNAGTMVGSTLEATFERRCTVAARRPGGSGSRPIARAITSRSTAEHACVRRRFRTGARARTSARCTATRSCTPLGSSPRAEGPRVMVRGER
jgi:outer membrane receptor protein involved in Fe transport